MTSPDPLPVYPYWDKVPEGLLTKTQLAKEHLKPGGPAIARVARLRGLDASGVLFASPIAPIGSRLCVSSRRLPDGVCGLVVDGPRPEHRRWQIETGRIIEVQPELARRLCRDATGPPRDCPVEVRKP